ncbi:hypothetical protein [Actinophytocola gossypii]|uniref:WXG100 family type VII secretion target n=1 Tax=Actinophytocola gossypii TaxID=2812003 RepID=A0ABT2J5G8_9PSEU|nr:hypothetical protein [Actinophytocola gossypii]MCT2582844.1 hypothetical protein [Actinophytocola gossypii]
MTLLAEKVPPQFWPTINRIDGLIAEHGVPVPQLGDTLRKIALFDPDAVRTAAAAWGTGGGDGLPGSMANAITQDLTEVVTKVGQRWEGEAWQAFKQDMDLALDLIARIGDPAGQIGDLLTDLAGDLEMGWEEIVGWILTLAGIVVMLATWETFVGAVVGAVITVIGLLLDAYSTVVKRLLNVNTSVEELERLISEKIPSVADAPTRPGAPRDWDARTTDPNT